jgi:hypothetical protein
MAQNCFPPVRSCRAIAMLLLAGAAGCSRTTVLGSADGGATKTALTITGTVCTTSPLVLRALFVEPISAARERGGWKPDWDGDGVSDAREGSPAGVQTADRDGDGFSDLVELANAAQGLDVERPDARGCDTTMGCTVTDGDGDELTQKEEALLGSDPLRIDSDGDGIPDGLEVRYGLSPAVANTGDSDGDTVSDLSEVAFATDPMTPDDPIASPLRFETRWTLAQETSTQRCYDVVLDNLPMAAAENQVTFFKLWKSAGPATGPRDQDEWTAACAQVRRFVDGTTLPADLTLTGLDDAHFFPPSQMTAPRGMPDLCLTPEGWTP